MNNKQKPQDLVDTIMVILFHHQLEIKMFHFQTKNYGAHKASDEYLGKFLSNSDRMLEVLQGKYGQSKLGEIDLKIKTKTDSQIVKALEEYMKFLNDFDNAEELADVYAIRDEMLADALQFQYLLMFD